MTRYILPIKSKQLPKIKHSYVDKKTLKRSKYAKWGCEERSKNTQRCAESKETIAMLRSDTKKKQDCESCTKT